MSRRDCPAATGDIIVYLAAPSPYTGRMSLTPPVQKPGLERALGYFMTTAIVIGTVIGSGVFKKPAKVALEVPQFGLAALVWIVAGLFVTLGALALAEVAVLYPRAGGNYVFLREAYGRLFGFLWGWVEFWIIRTASLAALATIFTESLHDVLTNEAFQSAVGIPLGSQLGFWTQKSMTIAVLLGLAGVNVLGVRWGGGLQFFITLIKIGSLLGIIVLPFVVLGLAPPNSTAAKPNVANLQPVLPSAWNEISISGLGSAFLAVIWAYHGWMNIAPIAGEVKRPQRNLPLALLTGVGVIVFLYLGANFAYYLVIPQPELAALTQTTKTTSTEFCLRLIGPLGAATASAALMCSVFGALNGNLLVGPRLLYAMGQDGLAPQALSAVHPRFKTPALAIAVMAIWSVLLVLSVAFLTETRLLDPKKSHFDMLTDFAMFGAVIFETMAVVSIFVFRFKQPDAERPYRCVGYPVTPALYVLLPLFVLVNMFWSQTAEATAGIGFIVLGVLVYFGLGLSRTGPAEMAITLPKPDREPPTFAPSDAISKAQPSVESVP
jgi:basic amino acid/polyamine antiporter, APA family